jgi:cell pole-organizing protein PopZ
VVKFNATLCGYPAFGRSVRRHTRGSQRRGGAAAGPEPQRSDETTTKPQAGLLSPRATTAVSSAVNRLTTSVKKQEPTLEDVVRDMLRPMLKSWLDENLPAVVERIVEAEIERAVRGR